MSSDVKLERADQDAIETIIVQSLQKKSDGLTTAEIFSQLSSTISVVDKDLVDALNNLIRKQSIKVAKLTNGEIIYQHCGLTPSNLRGLDNEEKLVYQIIEGSGHTGIWHKDIQEHSRINNKHLERILKSLESKKFVKQMRVVGSSRKKIYMASKLEPDTSVTGGAFYDNQVFNEQFVMILTQSCFDILNKRAIASREKDLGLMDMKNSQFMSTEEVLKAISDLSRVPLTLKEIDDILMSLVYDGKVEKNVIFESHKSFQTNLYRAISSYVRSSGLMHTPCGHCPVQNDCRPGNVISPDKCIYMKDWMDF